VSVRVLVGTIKGAFWLTSQDRETWDVKGPFFKGWKVTAGLGMSDGRFLVAVASDVYGPALHVTEDLDSWEQFPEGPSYGNGGDPRMRQIWILRENRGRIFAGVQDAGLFVSDDMAASWSPIDGLNNHPTRANWVPGAGGLCAHALVFHPTNQDRMWCGISAVGVFRTDDGGITWEPKNNDVPIVIADETHKNIGRCVHALAQDPSDPDRLYRQDHMGMYRTNDGGDSWEKNEAGLSSGFGFPIVIDRATATLFAAPQESDECRLPVNGAMEVYRSTDRGDTWHSASDGLPHRDSFGTVLRGAMDVDNLDQGGVYFGTTAGEIHLTRDLGKNWQSIPVTLPRVLHVSAWTR